MNKDILKKGLCYIGAMACAVGFSFCVIEIKSIKAEIPFLDKALAMIPA